MRRRRVRKRISKASHSSRQSLRRKKRRQPCSTVETTKRVSLFRFWVLCLSIFGVFLLALGVNFLFAYHNSTTFKKKLLHEIEARSLAKVELSRLKVQRQHAEARSLTMHWNGELPLLKTLKLKKLNADYVFGGFLVGNWGDLNFTSETGSLHLDSQLVFDSVASTTEEATVDITEGFSFIKCHDLDVMMNDQLLLKSTSARFLMADQRKTISFTKGDVVPEKNLQLEQGFVEIFPEYMNVDCRFSYKGGGEINVHQQLEYQTANAWKMNLQVIDLPSEHLLTKRLSKLLKAQWSGNGGTLTLPHHFPSVQEVSYSMQVTSEQLELDALDCFVLLSDILHIRWYNRPQFKKGATLEVAKYPDGSVAVQSLSAHDPEYVFLKGDMHWNPKEGHLKGELAIGIPEKYQIKLEQHFGNAAFQEAKDGYLWQKVILSGDKTSVQDDLREKLLSRRH